jgi:hypothetical protein
VTDEPRRIALLVVRDVLGAGLLGALAETEGFEPAFPLDGERGDLAVRRLRPALVLLDAYHPAARRDELFDACALAGCRVVLFAPGAPWEMALEAARRRAGAELVTAGPGESFAERLRAALRRGPG